MSELYARLEIVDPPMPIVSGDGPGPVQLTIPLGSSMVVLFFGTRVGLEDWATHLASAVLNRRPDPNRPAPYAGPARLNPAAWQPEGE